MGIEQAIARKPPTELVLTTERRLVVAATDARQERCQVGTSTYENERTTE